MLIAGCKKNGGGPSSSTSPVITSFNPAQGGNGITVTITGKNFGAYLNAVIVYFNGAIANPTAVNDSVITVNVPPAATTGKIEVQVNGQSAKTATDFVILPGAWVKNNAIPDVNGRSGAYCFAFNGFGYVGGGLIGGTTNLYTDLWKYDPGGGGIWQQQPAPPIALMSCVSMVINNKVYVGIGRNKDFTNTNQFWEFDPTTGAWARKADFPGQTRVEAIGFGVGNMGYAGLGLADAGGTVQVVADWWQYDPATNTWTQKASAPTAMEHLGGFVLNNTIYAGASVNASQWYAYNPTLDTWTQKADFPGFNPLGMASFAINGKGYVMGGGAGCWQYDITTDTWLQQAFFANFRVGAEAFAIGNNGYCGGGSDSYGIGYKDLWKFTP
jgi:hypothetical protein